MRDVNINVNEVQQKTFTLLNENVYLYDDDELLHKTNVSRIDDNNSKLISESENQDCSVYTIYKSTSEDMNGMDQPFTLEMITNHSVANSKVSILKTSQHTSLSDGCTEFYADNKGLLYIHRGIIYENMPVYIDIKFDYNLETNQTAELTILIHLNERSNTAVFLLSQLQSQLVQALPQAATQLILQNEIVDYQYILKLNFIPGAAISDLLGTGLSFTFNATPEKYGVEVELSELSIQIDVSSGEPKVVYTRTKEDGMDDNDLPDIKKYTISSNKIVYDSNTTGNASDDALAAVFTNGVTIEYDSSGNAYELALQASGEREYPIFVIDGDMPPNYKVDTNDNSDAQTRLNRVPFGIDGYTTIYSVPEAMDTNSIVNIISSNGNKYVFNDGSSYDANKKFSLTNGTYTFKNIPVTHPMAILNNGKETNIAYQASNSPIIIKVSGGQGSAPYYTFKDEQENNINIYTGAFKFMRGKTYKFQADGISSTHPFKIVYNKGTQSTPSISGSSGSFTVTMTNDDDENSYYQCAIHSTMKSNIQFLYGSVDSVDYNFYYGDIDVTVSGDFSEVSVYCLYHGYMGGENLLIYN